MTIKEIMHIANCHISAANWIAHECGCAAEISRQLVPLAKAANCPDWQIQYAKKGYIGDVDGVKKANKLTIQVSVSKEQIQALTNRGGYYFRNGRSVN